MLRFKAVVHRVDGYFQKKRFFWKSNISELKRSWLKNWVSTHTYYKYYTRSDIFFWVSTSFFSLNRVLKVSKVNVESVESECRKCRKWMSKVSTVSTLSTLSAILKNIRVRDHKKIWKVTKHNLSYSRVKQTVFDTYKTDFSKRLYWPCLRYVLQL